ncbi:methyl-accepting chemotaxis protein [Roseateles cellulosilyticus]|uniref:Methyl-accepting chemotaxis protein n=1 Tax=Pelomonas cellulosilytica TaxID=2906762 RepID=A0ABS8XYB7_9BURK|nr:methyl-accepting chemotaxis protein [Pelomonas sp. P8]MCE4557642.1 methyl-accepting chemotaxis protein [Pelomonas sp. P8]
MFTALSHQSIGRRMALVLTAVLLTSFLGSGIGYWALNRVAAESQEMYESSLKKERLASDWDRNLVGGVNRTMAVAASKDMTLAQFFAQITAESSKKSGELQKQLEPMMTTDAEKNLFAKLSEARKGYLSTRDAVFAAKKAGDAESAQKIFESQFQPAATQLQEAMRSLVQMQRDLMDAAEERSAKANGTARAALVVFGLGALALGTALAMWLTRSITRPLQRAAEVAEAIAHFDLTHDIRPETQDEVGRLLQALHDMQASLHKLIGEVRGAADSIGTASAEIATGNLDLSQRTEQTASNLQNAASSMAELTGTVKQTADAAMTANQLASSAASVAQKGGEAVSQVVATMDQISHSSRKINEIIGTIDGIAFQTNILALNAAVEAARAGEQGRGFAVVAGEVRLLAQRSAEAAKEIKSLISASVERVDSGTQQVQAAGSTMTEIVASVQRVTDIIGEISAAAREQSEGIGVVNGSVVQLDQMTQQNAALVEQSAAAAESLREQSARMAEAINVFRLSRGALQTSTRAPAVTKPATAPRTTPQKAATKPLAPKPVAPRPKGPVAIEVPAAPRATAPTPAPMPKPAAKPAAKPADDGDWETF